MIARSVEIKAHIVGADPHEAGMRSLLNYGHTIGHAVEVASHYTISHGQAVAIGLCMESYLSMTHAGLSSEKLEKIIMLLQLYGMQTMAIRQIDPLTVHAALYADKKCRGGIIYSAFIKDIGVPYVLNGRYTAPLEQDAFTKAWAWIASL